VSACIFCLHVLGDLWQPVAFQFNLNMERSGHHPKQTFVACQTSDAAAKAATFIFDRVRSGRLCGVFQIAHCQGRGVSSCSESGFCKQMPEPELEQPALHKAKPARAVRVRCSMWDSCRVVMW
jgi:hypothetical protein